MGRILGINLCNPSKGFFRGQERLNFDKIGM
jgi:hypothetical protein